MKFNRTTSTQISSHWLIVFCASILIAASTLFAMTQSREQADLNLVIAIDCSYSVDETEFNLQVHGTASAFSNPQVIKAITGGYHGKISVTVVQWSNSQSQVVVVPWTTIRSQIDALKFAIAVKSQTRQTAAGGTAISAMINRGILLHRTSPTIATRQVIDVVADGENNNGERVEFARNRAVNSGIVINGLTILNEVSYLHYYFQNRVIGGLGAFVEIADNYQSFATAIKRKLLREIYGNSIS